jgi:hypothetical protein
MRGSGSPIGKTLIGIVLLGSRRSWALPSAASGVGRGAASVARSAPGWRLASLDAVGALAYLGLGRC